MNERLSERIIANLRDVPDFPKPGIIFKDITPLLANPKLISEVIEELARIAKSQQPQAIAGIEARGFIFGSMLAEHLELPFIPIRKLGKLPWKSKTIEYDLEYGSASIEVHEDALDKAGKRVLLIDDLLATGGTCKAACQLLRDIGGDVIGYLFVIELGFLAGRKIIETSAPVFSLASVN